MGIRFCVRCGANDVNSYVVCGLSVLSEITLPGLIANPRRSAAADVTIREAPVPMALDEASVLGPTWQMADDSFLIRIPGIARFLLHGGRDIAFEIEDGSAQSEVAIFLVGTVFGILLHLRQRIVLHASAVRVGGKAVLFCGASGAGKSTIAAALGKHGFPLVTDDVCAIDLSNPGRITVQPDGRFLKLWSHAIENLELAEKRGTAVREKLEKFYVEPGDASADPLPLGAVYALREARPPHVPGIERPNVVDAALLLRRNAYRPLLVRRLGQKADYFHAAAAIANTAGIFHLTRVLNFTEMPNVISGLKHHWDEIGLGEKVPT